MTTGSTANQSGMALFFDVGQQRVEAALALQKELLEAYEHASRGLLTRLQSELTLWSELPKKLVGTRSVPEVLQAYGECISEQMKMTTEDGQRLFDDLRQVTEKVTRLLDNGRAAALQPVQQQLQALVYILYKMVS
jgi:hypothetical protein